MAFALLKTVQRTPFAASVVLQNVRNILTPPNLGDPTKTNWEIMERLSKSVIGGPSTYNPEKFQEARQQLMAILPRTQAELPPRRMLDSFDQALIPIGKDRVLRERYLNHLGGIRIGRLLEDMDVFAAHLVFQHILNPKQPPDSTVSPFSIVTALVDKIRVQKVMQPDQDIKISGHVTWVGTSSAESSLNLHQKCNGVWELVMEAGFVLVARDALGMRSAFINPLIVDTEEEKKLFSLGNKNKTFRLQSSRDSLFKTPPTEEEKHVIHDFFLQTVDKKAMTFKARVKPENTVWMEDGKLKSFMIAQPEFRNRFNKIFGGFLMRQAFELGWANACVYSRQRPVIEFMDDMVFEAPVDIGSLLFISSRIAYIEENFVSVRVSAEVLEPKSGERKVTNVFHYTFSTPEPPPKIIPKTYHEAMLYLSGRRHFRVFQDFISSK